MRATYLYSLLLAASIAVPAAANPLTNDGISVEHTVEARTSRIVLPTSPGGTLSYRDCSSCPTVSLVTTPTTRYQIGTQQVSLETMTKLFARGTYSALIAAKLNAKELLRLEVYLPASATGVTSHEE